MKKWIALFLACAMVLCLCACDKDDTANTTAAPTDATGEPSTTEPSGAGNGDNVDEGNENNPENNNQTPGTFDLLTKIEVEIMDATESSTMQCVLVYDDDFNVTGVEGYENGKLMATIRFDKQTMQMLEQTSFDENGNVVATNSFTYDANGNQLESKITNAAGEVTSMVVNTYTPEGWLESVTDQFGWERYAYDEHGNVVRRSEGVGDMEWVVYTYENTYKNGKLKEVKSYCGGDLYECQQYDAQGNLVLSLIYSDGEVEYRDVYTYQDGKQLAAAYFWKDTELYRRENVYNEAGQLITSSYIENGECTSHEAYVYDNGKLVAMKSYDQEVLDGETRIFYEKADVSEEQAEKLTALYDTLMGDL